MYYFLFPTYSVKNPCPNNGLTNSCETVNFPRWKLPFYFLLQNSKTGSQIISPSFLRHCKTCLPLLRTRNPCNSQQCTVEIETYISPNLSPRNFPSNKPWLIEYNSFDKWSGNKFSRLLLHFLYFFFFSKKWNREKEIYSPWRGIKRYLETFHLHFIFLHQFVV